MFWKPLPTGQLRTKYLREHESEEQMNIPELVKKEALRRGYSVRTIGTYQWCLEKFFRQYKKDPKEVKKADIYDYLDGMISKGKSGSTINVHHSALQFLFSEILHKRLMVNIKYSRRRKRLPEVLDKQETRRLLGAIDNKKYRLITALMYSSGLRISEVLSLKVKDLSLENNNGWVREGKGSKDRSFIVAENLKAELEDWIKDKSHGSYIFLSNRNRKFHPNSVRKILRKAAKRAGIQKNVYPHLLRHCFGTDVIKNGYTEAELQPLMGHKNIETTRTYVHVANAQTTRVKSPYDML